MLMANQKIRVFNFLLINFYFCNSLYSSESIDKKHNLPFGLRLAFVGVSALLNRRSLMSDLDHRNVIVKISQEAAGKMSGAVDDLVSAGKYLGYRGYEAARDHPDRTAIGVGLGISLLGAGASDRDARSLIRAGVWGGVAGAVAYVGAQKHQLSYQAALLDRNDKKIKKRTLGVGLVVGTQITLAKSVCAAAAKAVNQSDSMYLESEKLKETVASQEEAAGELVAVSKETGTAARGLQATSEELKGNTNRLRTEVTELEKGYDGGNARLGQEHAALAKEISSYDSELGAYQKKLEADAKNRQNELGLLSANTKRLDGSLSAVGRLVFGANRFVE